MRLDSENVLPAADLILTDSERAELIRAHYDLQKGAFISQWEDDGDWIRVYSEVSPVPMWNHAAWLDSDLRNGRGFLSETRQSWTKENRRPVVYFVEEPHIDQALSAERRRDGFERCDQESWMLYASPEPVAAEQSTGLQIRIAERPEERADFMEVFSAAYQAKGPGYARLFSNSPTGGEPDVEVGHYVAYADGRPVCIASLYSRQGLACIYNVGTLPQARQRGFAAQLMAVLLRDSQTAQHRQLFLQAEKGGGAERLYLRLGFRIGFTRAGYRLIDWSPAERARIRQRVEKPKLAGRQLLTSIHRETAAPERESGHGIIKTRCAADLPRAVQELADRLGVRAQTIWVAAWAVLLSRYADEAQVTFGIRSGQGELAGLSLDVPEQELIGRWLGRVDALLTAKAPSSAESVELESAVDVSASGRGSSRQGRCTLEWRVPSGPDLELAYARKLFDEETVARLSGHLLTLVNGILKHSEQPVSALELLTAAERRQLLQISASSIAAPVPSRLIHQVFEELANREPAARAVRMATSAPSGAGAAALTYGQLNGLANQLAQALRALGIAPGKVVGICMERSVEMIVALVAVFKAGGVCLPLDPTYPAERLELMLADSQAAVVLCQERVRPRVPTSVAKVVLLEDQTAALASQPQDIREPAREAQSFNADRQVATENLPAIADRESAAYIIYTSGSTGKPKGVVISQGAIASHCLEARQCYQLRPADKVLQFNSLSFDAAFEQIWGALISGAELILRGPEVWTSREFSSTVTDGGLTVVDLPTAYWGQVIQEWSKEPSSMPARLPRLFIVGGEAMSAESLRLWRQLPIQGVRLINAYGPTEATVTATSFEITPEFLKNPLPKHVPIGRARGGRTTYILDRRGRLVPMGMAGELFLGGPLLAQGYFNRPELTRERFVDNPFAGGRGEHLYKTGDLVRWMPDGNIEFLGRVDQQVKIRGFRVELGEIEATLQTHPALRASAVAVHQVGAHSQLTAYVVARNGNHPPEHELRDFLQQRLPGYMIPAIFVPMPSLPLLPGGKVDRRGLASMVPLSRPESVTGPRDPEELRLQLLFERVLQRVGIGVNVSFFELGGDSLQALELIVEIERMTGRSLPLETLYHTSTVEGLVRLLASQEQGARWSSLVPLQTGGSRPPLIFVHTTPGDILGYGNLIHHLDQNQPCYGLQSLGLSAAELSHHRIEDMARHYIDQVRALQPAGPYYLAGWCYGGIVAVEMAQQLRVLGEQVAFLGLLETVAPSPGWRVRNYYLHRLQCFLRMSPKQWLRYFAKKMSYYREVKLANKMRFRRLESASAAEPRQVQEHNERLAKLEHVYATNLNALKSYQPRPYPGPVILFNATDIDPGVIPDPLYAWPGLAAEIEVHQVPGDHDTMLTEPNVAVLARELDRVLGRAQRAGQEARDSEGSARAGLRTASYDR